MTNTQNIFTRLRQHLVCGGTGKVVSIANALPMLYNEEDVQQALNELEKACLVAVILGEPISTCHRLLLEIFMDATGVKLKED